MSWILSKVYFFAPGVIKVDSNKALHQLNISPEPLAFLSRDEIQVLRHPGSPSQDCQTSWPDFTIKER